MALASACSNVEPSLEAATTTEAPDIDLDGGLTEARSQANLEASGDYADFVDLGDINDPVESSLVYACNGLVASAEDLAVAFASEELVTPSRLTARLLEHLGEADFSGDATTWAELETGWFIDRDPLTQSPASFTVLGPAGDQFVCSFRRAGFFASQPIAWQLGDDGAVAIESCVDPADVVVDRREIAGVDVVTLFGPQGDIADGEAAEPDCSVDGSVTMTLPGSAIDESTTLSGYRYPFATPDPSVFQTLVPFRQVATVPDTLIEDLSCSAFGGVGEVVVAWSPLPAAYSATLVANGEDLFEIRSPRFEESAEAQAARVERMTSYGAASFQSAIQGSFSDTLIAAGEQRSYELEVAGSGATNFTVDCGSASSNDFAENADAPIEVISGDLGSAAQLFAQSAVGPYAYLTVVAICGGCSDAPIDLQMASGGSGHDWSPDLKAQTDLKVDGVLNPFTAHTDLDAAERAGKTVEFTVDSLAGVVTSYTIDGVGAKVLCFEVDTAPPELRGGASCNPEWDLTS